jgi:acyl-CoA reductase-like NAD-dependent aldehyde dehydrogenase
MVERYANCINGKWLAPGTGDYVANINPADPAEILGMFPASGGADVEQAIAAAVAASEGWRRVPGPERGKLLLRFADLLEQHTDPLAKILTKEQGKPLKESVGEVK